jgi:hypothetical protein
VPATPSADPHGTEPASPDYQYLMQEHFMQEHFGATLPYLDEGLVDADKRS